MFFKSTSPAPFLPSGASWPRIDPQMLPWWGGRGQGRRVPGGPAESLCPKMPMGHAGEKGGEGSPLWLRDGLIRLSAKKEYGFV